MESQGDGFVCQLVAEQRCRAADVLLVHEGLRQERVGQAGRDSERSGPVGSGASMSTLANWSARMRWSTMYIT